VTPDIRWGILGTGGIAQAFASDLATAGRTVAAVGSRTPEAARAFAARHGIPRAHGSYEALVADDAVDVVYVATPHPFHAANALLALDAGKHVLVEKPFTLDARQARAVAKRAAERRRFALEAMWTRFLPHMVRIREIVAAGALGDVRTIIADHNQDLPRDPAHRLNDPHLGGGALLDLGIYPVSFACDLLGLPGKVAAIAAMTATGVDRQTAILLGHEGGRQAVLHCALDTRGPNTASVIGTLGRIEIEPVWYMPTSFQVFDRRGEVVERYRSEVAGRGMQYQALEAERRIAAGELASPLLPLDETVAIMEVLDEVRRQIGLRYPGE
jgi:predicted dehydrogenase